MKVFTVFDFEEDDIELDNSENEESVEVDEVDDAVVEVEVEVEIDLDVELEIDVDAYKKKKSEGFLKYSKSGSIEMYFNNPKLALTIIVIVEVD